MIIDEDLCLCIFVVCGELDVDGLWGDIVINCVVWVLVVFEGCMDVSEEDVVCVVFCCLCYCFCKDFFE